MAEENKETASDLVWFVIKVVGIMFLAWLVLGGPNRVNRGGLLNIKQSTSTKPTIKLQASSTGQNFNSPKPTQTPGPTTGEVLSATTSPYKGKIRIKLENARSVYQPDEEYISLYAPTSNKENINITGWKLKNGKDEKVYERSGQLLRYSADSASIPKGLNYFYGQEPYNLEPIKLRPGDRAYLVTGRMPNIIPFSIPYSFRLNKCSGYIDSLPDYTFTPALPLSCPRATEEAKQILLDESCSTFLKSIRICHTPKIGQDGSVDNKLGVGQNCRAFIEERLNYVACVQNHIGDPDFLSKNWMVYLKYPGELWPKTGSVTLYDQNGKVVDRVEY